MTALAINDKEFALFQSMMRELAGVRLTPNKKAMVCGRLSKRLVARGASSFEEYFHLISEPGNGDELQRAVDLLTTHETYFFREPQHFELLGKELVAQARPGQPFRVWSAACSTGEEPYSIAMVLMDRLGPDAPWEVIGTDISAEAVATARRAVYATTRIDGLPPDALRRHCLRGVGNRQGTLLISRALREHVRFGQANLIDDLSSLGQFDVVFLRNVMIYFDQQTKCRVVHNVGECIADNGHLLIGHSESLNGIASPLKQVRPTVYRKVPA
jgi:chemotaxis protein methyltransferase CheR